MSVPTAKIIKGVKASKDLDYSPDIERDHAKILTEAFKANPKLAAKAKSFVEAIKRDGLVFIDDHRSPTIYQRDLRAIGFDYGIDAGVYDYLDAWLFPYMDVYNGQCKNPLYIAEDQKLHVTRCSRGMNLTFDLIYCSQETGFLEKNDKNHCGMIVQPFKSSWLKDVGSGPHYRITLIVRSENIVDLFERCLANKDS